MLERERFIKKAEKTTGETVLFSTEARRTVGDRAVGDTGLLCAFRGGLVFVEEEILDPGEVWTVSHEEIRSAQLTREVLDASLRIRTADEEVLFEHLDADGVVDLVDAARVPLATRDSSPDVSVSDAADEDLDSGEAWDDDDEEPSSESALDEEQPLSQAEPPPAPRHRPKPPPAPRRAAAQGDADPAATKEAPKGSRPVALAAIIGLVGLGGVVWGLLQGSDQASLVIEVRRDGEPVEAAEIFVGGQKRCDFSPCTLELDPGTKRVRAKVGETSETRTVLLKGGKRVLLELNLRGAKDGDGAAKGAKTATLELYGSSPGIEVFVNGQRKGTLPVVLMDIPPGKVELLFKGGEKYRSLERTIDLAAGKTLVMDDIKLPLRIVEVEFVVDEAVTSAELVRTGHPERVTPLEVRNGRATRKLDTSHRWAVRAKGEGGLQLYLPISFEDGEAKKTLQVVFPREPQPESEETAAGAESAPPSEPAALPGKLVISSIPPAQVIVDGRALGTTPLTDVEVSEGTHAVVFVHEQHGRKSRTVHVEAGQKKVVAVRF